MLDRCDMSCLPLSNLFSHYRVQETLPQEILAKMHAPAKPEYPVITPDILATYDAFILGIPTRYGNMPAQWKVCFSSFLRRPSSLPHHNAPRSSFLDLLRPFHP